MTVASEFKTAAAAVAAKLPEASAALIAAKRLVSEILHQVPGGANEFIALATAEADSEAETNAAAAVSARAAAITASIEALEEQLAPLAALATAYKADLAPLLPEPEPEPEPEP